jgi:hypothetical protein
VGIQSVIAVIAILFLPPTAFAQGPAVTGSIHGTVRIEPSGTAAQNAVSDRAGDGAHHTFELFGSILGVFLVMELLVYSHPESSH